MNYPCNGFRSFYWSHDALQILKYLCSPYHFSAAVISFPPKSSPSHASPLQPAAMPSISTLQKANFSSCTPEERAVPVSPKCQTPHFSRHVSGLRWNLRPGLYVGLPLVSYGLLTHHSNSYLGAPSFSGSDASQALCRVVKVVWGGHKKGLLYAFSSYRDRSTLKQVSGLTLAILGFEEDVVNASLWDYVVGLKPLLRVSAWSTETPLKDHLYNNLSENRMSCLSISRMQHNYWCSVVIDMCSLNWTF